MAERPIIFSGEMVRAILAGRKTMTRRLLRKAGHHNGEAVNYNSPYRKLQPGDRLWVRETWADVNTDSGPAFLFRADSNYRWCESDAYPVKYERYPGCVFATWGADLLRGDGRWRSPIHMPRWASRITLEVTAVKIERLQDISEEDAAAEGVEPAVAGIGGWSEPVPIRTYRTGFVRIWNDLHGESAWLDNPDVVAISFRQHPRPSRSEAAHG